MLFRKLGLWVAMVGAGVGFAMASACGGSSTSNSNGGSGGAAGAAGSGTGGTSNAGAGGTTTDASAGSGGGSTGPTCDQPNSNCKLPPKDPGGPAADGTTPTVFAIKALYLGDTDRQGNASTTAWQDFGYNLDNLVSGINDTNHCTPQPGAPADIKQDGPGGVDNAFGKYVIPFVGNLAGNLSQTVDGDIDNGTFTVLVKFDNLGTAATESGVTGALYAGENLGHAPLWDGTDAWPVAPELLNNGDINDPKVTFPASYINNNTWVSGTNGTVSLSLSVQGQTLTININDAVVSMDIAADRSSATNGIIAGVINTQNLLDEVQKIAGSFSSSFCSSSAFDSIASVVKGFSDIMSDGTNGDPSKTCDGISIGIGFDASPAQLGSVAPVQPPPPNPCADAGP
jgi:hypothetical protein